jgi:3-dehydroquinate synthase
MEKIQVSFERKNMNAYEILVGQDILDRSGLIMARSNWAKRYFIITDSNLSKLHGERVQAILTNMGLKTALIEFPAGEASKNIHTCLELIEKLIGLGADRTSGLIALGGGVVGDIAGFIASTYMRGIPYVQIPTTLLAQVDSSIGGKTAIDLPEGKNLMGNFYQPKAVFIDLSFLRTLPAREFKSGLAEIVKCGIIDDPELFAILETGAGVILERNLDFLEPIVLKTCQIKKGIEEMDETDKGMRRYLNFGHTLGHAIETHSSYAYSHGEAISMGMVAAAAISQRMKYLPVEDQERIVALMEALRLPRLIPQNFDTAGILSRLKVDKKKTEERVNFILLKRLGVPFVNGGVPEEIVRQVVEELKG